MELSELNNRKASSESPLFSFGVITDIQYGDLNDGRSFHGNSRFYRDALDKTRRAVKHWNDMGDIDFVLQLGDIVDGWNKERSKEMMERVLNVMEEFKGKIYHTFGNHELYNMSRDYLIDRLRIREHVHDQDIAYFSFSPYPGWRIAMLDTFDLSFLGRDEEHPHSLEAKTILEQRNPNKDKNAPPDDPNNKWFVKFNGGISKQQLEWLDNELRRADSVGEKVILCSHVPFHPEGAGEAVLVWNYPDVLQLIDKHSCVVAVISGHDHEGGYNITSRGQQDSSGHFGVVHYCILEAVLESPPGLEAHGRVDVYDDRLELIGYGKLSSYTMPFKLHKSSPVSIKK